MKQRYRLLYVVLGISILLFIIFFEKNIGLASLAEEVFINGCMNITIPGMKCYCEPQELQKDTIYDDLLRTTVPVSAMLPKNNDDYILLADDACNYDNVNTKADNEKDNEDSVETKKASEADDSVSKSSDGKVNSNGNKIDGDALEAVSRKEVTGTVYNRAELSDYGFVHNHFYTITSITELTESILRPAEFIDRDLSIDKSDGQPKILIFHTHSQEGFTDSVEGDASTTIVGVGDYLTELLRVKYGYNVIHDTSVYDYVDGKLDRSKAYTYAEEGIAQILKDNPSIEVVIDLHRDGVADTTHLITEVDGKSMAKVMFFNGLSYSKVNGDIAYLSNPYRDDNLAMSLQMQLLGEAYYPGYLRKI